MAGRRIVMPSGHRGLTSGRQVVEDEGACPCCEEDGPDCVFCTGESSRPLYWRVVISATACPLCRTCSLTFPGRSARCLGSIAGTYICERVKTDACVWHAPSGPMLGTRQYGASTNCTGAFTENLSEAIVEVRLVNSSGPRIQIGVIGASHDPFCGGFGLSQPLDAEDPCGVEYSQSNSCACNACEGVQDCASSTNLTATPLFS